MSEVLYNKYRPDSCDKVVGQPHADKIISGFFKKKNIPHAILFTGPPGVGKTTYAKIIAKELGSKSVTGDLVEMNCAEQRGIETMREIKAAMEYKGFGGGKRVWILDEVQQSTKDFQSALLQPLEQTPLHVYFILCTTDPHKLLPTILSRCSEIKLKPINPKEIEKQLNYVLKKEKEKLKEDVIDKIVEVADGSMRKGLVLLEQVLAVKGNTEEQMQCVLATDQKRASIELARLLLNTKTKWLEVCTLLQNIEGEPEELRRLVLAYSSAVAMGKAVHLHSRSIFIIECFRDHYYDCGKAGLVASCFEVINGK